MNISSNEIKRLETEIKFKELLISEGYAPLFDRYVNSSTKVLIRHEVCGGEYYSTLSRFNRGNRCKPCSLVRINKQKTSTIEDYKLLIETNTNNEYILLSTIVGNVFFKVLVKHNTCGNEYLVKPNVFQRGSRCPNCMRTKIDLERRLSIEDYKQTIEVDTNNEYTLMSKEITLTDNNITLKHNICGNEYLASYNNFKNGTRCPNCFLKKRGIKCRLSIEDYKQTIEVNTNNEYTLMSKEIKLVHDKILIKHNICGNEYLASYTHFKNGTRCPRCSKLNKESKGVLKIKGILNYLNINFIQEYIFNECVNIKPLPFDFYVPLNNNKCILIEYDGLQHFKPGWKKDVTILESQQLRDSIKNQYCLENNIPLLRIPYTDKNSEETLITFLEEYEDLLIFK